jgi:hypothetical protein
MPELVRQQLACDLSAETWGRLQAAIKARDLIAETLARADAEVEALRRLRYGSERQTTGGTPFPLADGAAVRASRLRLHTQLIAIAEEREAVSDAPEQPLAVALREAAEILRYTDHTTAPDDARAALAVAAFLRALPRAFDVPVRLDCGWTPNIRFRADWTLLARAVEAADV